MDSNEALGNLVLEWQGHAERAHQCHYEASLFYERLFLSLGIPVIILSAFTGGSEVLGLLGENVAGVISLCVAVLAGLQTFLKYSQLAERHRTAGARYGSVKRSIEEVKILLAEAAEDAKAQVHEIKNSLDSLALESPEIPERLLVKYQHDVRVKTD